MANNNEASGLNALKDYAAELTLLEAAGWDPERDKADNYAGLGRRFEALRAQVNAGTVQLPPEVIAKLNAP